MNVKEVICVVFAAFLLLHIVSATFIVDLNASTLKKTYNIGDTLSGNLIITWINESADSQIMSNLGPGSTSLNDWLKSTGRREVVDYNCSFQGCASSYKAKDAITSLNLASHVPQIFGFKMRGFNVSVNSLSFTVASDISPSCILPFSIDALNKGQYSFDSYSYSNTLCSPVKQGCFDYTLNTGQYQTVNLTNVPFCEKIFLPAASAYQFSANLTHPSTAPDETISMRLYNKDFTVIYGNCTFSGLQGNNSCVLPYPITRDNDYQVCVMSNRTNSAYQIRSELVGSICGTATMGQSLTRDFDVGAQALGYSSGVQVYNDDSFALLNNEQSFTDAINGYLQSEYNSSCLNSDCFIPFKIIGEHQSVNIGNTSLAYDSDGVPITENIAYSIEKSPSTITSTRIVLPLDNLKLNVTQKTDFLQLSIENRTLLRIPVNITNIPLSIKPTFALIGIPTTFGVTSVESIASATWKFSSDPVQKNGINVTETFTQPSTYTVEVTATTQSGKVYTKSQQIMVGEPRASALELYQLAQESVDSLNTDIVKVPSWLVPGVSKHLNVVTLNNSLQTIKQKLDVASNDTEYSQIIDQLQTLNIPNDVSISRTGTVPIIATYDNMDIQYAQSLYQLQNVSDSLKTSITEWTIQNYDSTVETNTYSATTITGDSAPLLTHVKITLTPKATLSNTPYLIIDYPIEALHFKEGYSQKELQSGTYIPLSGTAQTIEFYIESDTTPNNLGVYILPALANLQNNDAGYEVVQSTQGTNKSILYIGLAVVIIILIAALVAVQYWYRNNYEKHLFGDAESLFNIMTFIYNSKKKGLLEGDIRKALLSSGWTREQINYALGRFKGKILGVMGIPIYSARQEEKMRTQIENRQRQNTGRKVY